MYVVVRSGNKQFPVKVGSVIKVDMLPYEEGSPFVMKDVLFAANDEGKIVKDVTVDAIVLKHSLDDKVLIFKKKRRKNHRRKRGFRHSVTFVKIDNISF